MKYDSKLLIKLSLIFFGILFLVCIWLGRKHVEREAPEGEAVSVEDVRILLEALGVDTGILENRKAQNEYGGDDRNNTESSDSTEALTYAQYITIYGQIGGAAYGIPDFADSYEADFPMLKSDWYEAYRLMLAYLDEDSSIWETTVFLLKVNTDTKEAYTENGSMQGAYQYCSAAFEENAFQKMRVYVQGDKLLTIIEALPEEHYLGNVWVMESADGVLECFYRQICFTAPLSAKAGEKQIPEREKIADITFLDGEIVQVKQKDDKVHGKLLRVGENEIEIEGCGVYKIAEDMEIYKLYSSLETLSKNDLKIGYEDTDFVISKDKICACLVSKDEAADTIRVLLKNTANNSNYHEEVELVVDGDTILVREKDLEIGERRIYQSANLTDQVQINFPDMEQKNNAYRGSIECYRTGSGMALINELPLEEYLYAVVPSEMPASYPVEALMAQAVCARTYGYRYVLHAGIPELGAHVDDTTAYQVYHNSSESSAATQAVKETDGIILTYQGEPAETYYYSTSCGVGTDTNVWNTGGDGDTSYMQAVRFDSAVLKSAVSTASFKSAGCDAGAVPEREPDKLREEETFRQFITTKGEEDLEKDEPWYRWSYQVNEIDTEAMLKRLQERYQAAPESILTKADGNYYAAEPIEELGEIQELAIEKRGAGGVAEELLITAGEKTYKIIAEYNIRYVLCDRESEAVRQDGTVTVPKSLLPSGFFIIEAGKSDENVIGYTLIGGGYGHGVGMSQNGAKALGKNGVAYAQILNVFFPGCELEEIKTVR